MTTENVRLDDLITTRAKLIEQIKTSLTSNEKDFLLSFKNKQPQWELLGLDNIENLPAVQWKLYNLNLMSTPLNSQAYKKLESYLLT